MGADKKHFEDAVQKISRKTAQETVEDIEAESKPLNTQVQQESPAKSNGFSGMMNWVKNEAAWAFHTAEDSLHAAEEEVETLVEHAHEWYEQKRHDHEVKALEKEKARLLAADSKIHLHFAWRPFGNSTWSQVGGPSQATLQAMMQKAPKDFTSMKPIAYSASKTIHDLEEAISNTISNKLFAKPESEDSRWRGWPSYVLLVGIDTLDKVVVDETKPPNCYVCCDVLPVVSESGVKVSERTDGITKKQSSVIQPEKASLAGLATSTDTHHGNTRKVSKLLSHGVPLSVISDALDIDPDALRVIVGSLVAQRSDLFDVEFDSPFIYFLDDPAAAVITLEAFRNDDSIGHMSFSTAPLLQKPGLTEDFTRLPLHGGCGSRISGRVQLWHLVKGIG